MFLVRLQRLVIVKASLLLLLVLEMLERKVHRVRLVLKAQQDQQVPLERLVLRVMQARKAQQGQQVPRGMLVLRAILDLRGQRERRVLRVQRVQLDHKVQRAILA
jgi:hypothetical protein